MREPPTIDSGVDLPAAATPVTVDARPDGRQPAQSAVDAHSDVLGDVARDATTKTDAVPKSDALSSDAAGVDGRPDARSDAKSDATKAETNMGTDSNNHDGPDTGATSASEAGALDAAATDGLSAASPAAGDLVIDELLINPAGTDTNREWIEIANVSSVTLDLHQLHVADTTSDVVVDAGVLAPGGLLVLGQSLDPTKNGGAPIAVSFGNVVSLNNGGDSNLGVPRPVCERRRARPGGLGRRSGRRLRRTRGDRRRGARSVLPRGPAVWRRRQLRQPRRGQSAVCALTRPPPRAGARIVLSPDERKICRCRPHPSPRCWPGQSSRSTATRS